MSQKQRFSSGFGSCLVLALLTQAAAADAQQACKPCVFEQDLVEPCQIDAGADHVLDTRLPIELVKQEVPVWQNLGTAQQPNWQCCLQEMTLRSYVSPAPQCQQQYQKYKRWLPGPTLHVRKPKAKGGKDGDRIKVLLVNDKLGPDSNHTCNRCDCTLSPKPKCCAQCDCTLDPQPKCCEPGGFRDTFPNCFHGDNTTNLHFHGSHVSPQRPQDYVLLELQPKRSGAHEGAGSPSHGRGEVVGGTFQYDVNPLRWTQPEGTHWYHPHKHGSVALQVGSGMAGALIVRGEFDDWLRDHYQEKGQVLQEHVLVLQQIHMDNNFEIPGPVAPQPLINGQASPNVKMYPNQIQRWRLVSATMEGGAQFAIDFDGPFGGPLRAKQIAMDGIQLAPGNYQRQPLLPQNVKEIVVSPGNRIDLLVKAPPEPGKYFVTYEVIGAVEGEERRKALAAIHKLRSILRPQGADAAVPSEPTLLTVEVVPPCPSCTAMEFPIELPPLPEYLRDIPASPIKRDLWFRLENASGQDVGPATQPSKFFINFKKDENQQYNPNCVPITAKLGDSEEWTILNTTRRVTKINDQLSVANPFHVFHIHTNPFQVVETWGLTRMEKGKDVCAKFTYDPPVWQDSITLPSACTVDNVTQPGYVKIRQRYEEFTGEFVLHCHFLGHEDRGMMLGVQIVCPEKPDSYGKAKIDGPECVLGNYIPAAPRCPGT